MAAAIVPRLLPSVCQLQCLAPQTSCTSSRSSHHQQWRLRAPPAAASSHSLRVAAHWRIRVSAEPVAEANGVESEEIISQIEVEEEAQPEALADGAEVEAEADESKQPSSEEAGADQLIMTLKADGSVSDISIPTVKTALESMENVSDVVISTCEGLTSITLTKKTVIQATNVASEIVDAMEKAGFRLHTLNLAIDDEE